MKQFKHPLCNDSLAPAAGDAGKVDALWIQRDLFQGAPCVRSFWQPAPDELACLNAGGAVVLTLLGHTHAPLRLDAVAADGSATPGAVQFRHDEELLSRLYAELGGHLADYATGGALLAGDVAVQQAIKDMAKTYALQMLRRYV